MVDRRLKSSYYVLVVVLIFDINPLFFVFLFFLVPTDELPAGH